MIAKLETGNGFGGALRYDVRAGKGTPKELARVLDACGVSYDFNDEGGLLINPKQVGFDFRQQTMGYTGEGVIRKPVYHWVLSYHPDDKVPEGQMIEDAKEFLKRVGFDDTQYVMTAHYDKEHDHLHIVTNVVNNQGKRIPTLGLIDKAHAAAATITKDRGYVWGEKTKKENITANKMYKPHERVREIIEPMIREALATSSSLYDFQAKLIEDYGIMCNYTAAKDGKRGRISFCYEYEKQLHSFKGSSVAKDLSFFHVYGAIQANSRLQEANRVERESYWNSYNSHYMPLIAQVEDACEKAFSMYQEAKEQYGICSAELTDRFSLLHRKYTELRRTEEKVKEATTAKNIIMAVAAVINVADPFAALLLLFVALILKEAMRSDFIATKKNIRNEAADIRDQIITLQERQAELRRDKADRLKVYVENKEVKTELQNQINNLKVELDKPVEAPNPKITFDFIAAAQKTAQSQTTRPVQATPALPSVNIYSVAINARTREEFIRPLLSKKVAVEPMVDRYGGVADFKVTFAEENRVVNASRLMSPEQLRQMLDRWGSWTGQAPAYKLAIDRNHREKLADICKKIDQCFSDGAPRTPRNISFRQDGSVESVSYINSKGQVLTLNVDSDNYIRWNNGSALNIITGRYYAPRPQIKHAESHHNPEHKSAKLKVK